MGKVQG
jgi:2-oxoglutarate dehydrogenase E1 component